MWSGKWAAFSQHVWNSFLEPRPHFGKNGSWWSFSSRGPLAGWARKLLAWETQKQPRYNRGSEAVCLQCLGHWTETLHSILCTKLCMRSEPMALRRVLLSSYWLRNYWVFSLSQTSSSLSCELLLSCCSVWLSYLDMAWIASPEVRRARIIIPSSLLGNQGWNEMIGPEDTLLAEDTWPHPVSSALCFVSFTHPPSLLCHVSVRQCDKRTNTDRMRSKVIPPWSLFCKIFLETVSLSVHCLGKHLRLERTAFSCGF